LRQSSQRGFFIAADFSARIAKRAEGFQALVGPCSYESEMDQLNRNLQAQIICPEDYVREAARISRFYDR
jgi:hypothetical protein